MSLKTRLIPCLDVKDASHARSGNAARTGKTKVEAVR
jgi:imidazole glycerol phosphate synthase subunit HisF